jgi:hypothetical protein
MGPRLSAAPCASAKHLDRRGYVLDWRQAIIAGCSMIMAWLQTRFSTGAASSGSSPWKGGELADHAAANRVRGDLDRRLVLRDSLYRSRTRAAYPSPISSAPTGFTILAGSSNQSSRWHRACSSHCRLASDDGRRSYEVCFAPTKQTSSARSAMSGKCTKGDIRLLA